MSMVVAAPLSAPAPLSVAQQRAISRLERKSTPPPLPLVLEKLERRLKEKAHTRSELLAWLDGPHAWQEWEGQLSTHLFETRSGPKRIALDAFREANPCVDVELREGNVETFVYRLAYSFRNKKGLEVAIRNSRAGISLPELIQHMEGEYKNIKQDVEALIREKLIFAVDDDRSGGKKGKVLFGCIDRGAVEPLFLDKEARKVYSETSVPEYAKVLEILQESDFRLPEDMYRRKRDRVGLESSSAHPVQPAAGRKRGPRPRNVGK